MTAFPSVFVSHGAPTFALEPGLSGAQLRALGLSLGKPAGVVVVSPHWMTRGLEITASAAPQTIHDFGGFDPALYDLHYGAPGSPALAGQVAQSLASLGLPVTLHPSRGLDHGVWVPLMHMYPDADTPVVQVSLPYGYDAAQCLALGRALAPLRDEGVLVIGSGSLTHNLREFRMNEPVGAEYVREFTHWIRDAVRQRDHDRLLHALEQAPHARRAHPTSEHFLPLLVAAGAGMATGEDPGPVTVLDGGVLYGMLAMESYVFGRDVAEAVALASGRGQ